MSESTLAYRANWPAPANVQAYTSYRTGGVSKSPFDLLNLAQHVGDEEAAVIQNRARIQQELDLPRAPVWLEQTHSTRVVSLDAANPDTAADGSLTSTAGVVCAVMTADCLPLFLSNTAGDKVAVVHAGWRGMADGIIERGLEAFNEPASNVIAYAGPCISIEHFEVGLEVRDQLGGSDQAYNYDAMPGKCYADLYQLCRERLSVVGVSSFTHSEHCSYRDESLFYSYRRNNQCGRMASLIWFN